MADLISPAASTRVDVDLRTIRHDLGVSRERMARLLDVSAKTIERWEERASPPPNQTARERLLKLRQIVDLGLQVYTPDAFRAFLTLPMPSFNGRTPLQLIEMGDIDSVYAEIVADYEGGGY